jgi:hypothetical protein
MEAMKNLKLVAVLSIILTFLCLTHYLFDDFKMTIPETGRGAE